MMELLCCCSIDHIKHWVLMELLYCLGDGDEEDPTAAAAMVNDEDDEDPSKASSLTKVDRSHIIVWQVTSQD